MVAILSSCSQSNTAESNNTDQSEEIISEATTFSDGQSDNKWLRRASIMAQSYVKSNFAADANFRDLDYRGEESPVVANRYKVLQKFTATVDGREQDFIYRIWIQYYGGEWEDKNNWDYGELTIENVGTGRQWRYDGGMKAKEKVTSGKSNVGGTEYSIVEAVAPNYIRICTPKRLKDSEIRTIATELGRQYDSIFFCTNDKKSRGEEYVNVQGDIVFDYRGGGIKNLDEL